MPAVGSFVTVIAQILVGRHREVTQAADRLRSLKH
jgi:hypothetical protein